jgi:hypothetical protein
MKKAEYHYPAFIFMQIIIPKTDIYNLLVEQKFL